MRKIKTSKKLAVSAFALAASAALLFPGNVLAAPTDIGNIGHDATTDVYTYYTDNQKQTIQTSFTGVAWAYDSATEGTASETDLEELRYFEKGVSTKYNGLAPYTVNDSQVVAGLKKVKYVYFKDGKYKDYNGIAEYEGVQYLVVDGVVNDTTLGLNIIYEDSNNTKTTFKIKGGKVDTAFTGLVAAKAATGAAMGGSKGDTIPAVTNITTAKASAEVIYRFKDGALDKKEGFASSADVLADDNNCLLYFKDGMALTANDTALDNSVRPLGDNKNTWLFISSNSADSFTIGASNTKVVTVDYDANGLAKNKKNNTLWVVEDGIVNFKYSGIYKNELTDTNAAIVNDWKVEKNLTAALDTSDFLKITNGQVDKSFTGFVDYKVDETNVKSLKVYFNDGLTGEPLVDANDSYNRGAVRPLGDAGNTWVVVSKMETAPASGKYLVAFNKDYDCSLAPNPNNYTYWYVEEGKVNFGFSGNAGNDYDAINNNDTPIVPDYDENDAVFVLNGQVYVSTYTGFVKTSAPFGGIDVLVDTYYYLVDGEVKAFANGAVRPLGDAANTWYYVNNRGVVDFGFTGVAENPNTLISWYVKNGVVDFSYTGEYQAANNITYTIENGKVISASIK